MPASQFPANTPPYMCLGKLPSKKEIGVVSLCTAGRPWRRERGQLSLLPGALHGAVVERSQVHRDHCWHEEVSTPPLPVSVMSSKTFYKKKTGMWFYPPLSKPFTPLVCNKRSVSPPDKHLFFPRIVWTLLLVVEKQDQEACNGCWELRVSKHKTGPSSRGALLLLQSQSFLCVCLVLFCFILYIHNRPESYFSILVFSGSPQSWRTWPPAPIRLSCSSTAPSKQTSSKSRSSSSKHWPLPGSLHVCL